LESLEQTLLKEFAVLCDLHFQHLPGFRLALQFVDGLSVFDFGVRRQKFQVGELVLGCFHNLRRYFLQRQRFLFFQMSRCHSRSGLF